jgi:hypothetical protein
MGYQNLLALQNTTLWIHMEDMEWAGSTFHGFVPSNCVILAQILVMLKTYHSHEAKMDHGL